MSVAGKKPEIIVETSKLGGAAKVTRPDGVTQIIYNADDLLGEMLYCSGEWSGAFMVDRRGWKFPGEA